MAEPVRATLQGSFLTNLEIGKHRLVADEPVSAGGTDQGPTAYGLLASALATCTAMTIHFYARREKFPLTGVDLTVTHDRSHAKDCFDCESKEGYVHRFEVKIKLEGDLTEMHRTKLLEIAGRCPVAKTLQNQIKIHHTLV